MTSESKTYFKWMCQLVCNERYFKRLSYQRLLIYLDSIDFMVIVPMDDNRAKDGIDLRYRFEYETGVPIYDLRNKPCSVLEMMIALAIRCEEHIMDDDNIGDRTGQWFWNMIVNLGLGSMSDAQFDKKYVDNVVLNFLNRDYAPNGKGGLFTINNCRYDLRTVEIWYQMCWYLDNILRGDI